MASYRVAIIGASSKADRYAYKAMNMLLDDKHDVFLVHPTLKEIEGIPVVASPQDLKDIHTVTLYVRPEISNTMEDELINLAPKRVIFNPGTENPTLEKVLAQQGIEVVQACTLVLLSTNQF